MSMRSAIRAVMASAMHASWQWTPVGAGSHLGALAIDGDPVLVSGNPIIFE